MNQRKFVWVGRNRKFNEVWVSPPMTTTDLLERNYLSFFHLSNRDERGNCEFILEVFEGDNLLMVTQTSTKNILVKSQNGKFIGISALSTQPLEEYFSDPKVISIKINN